MNRKKILLLAVVATVLLLALYLTFRIGFGTDSDTTQIYGNVDIREATLGFRVAGRLSDIRVDEGARVRAGDVLAELDREPLLNSLHQAEANVAALQASNDLLHQGYRQEDKQQARAQVAAAQAALTEAERQLTRLRTLKPHGAATQSGIDIALSQRDQTAAKLHIAQAETRKMESGFRPQEVAESDANLAAARSALAAAGLAVADATLKSPSDGIILTRAVELGELVQVGTSAFTLSLTRPVWVRAYVAEPQLGYFPLGAKVTLWTDSRPDTPYHGVVGFVSPDAEFTPKAVETTDLRTSLVYRIRIVVKDADAMLRQGMPVTVRLAQDAASQ